MSRFEKWFSLYTFNMKLEPNLIAAYNAGKAKGFGAGLARAAEIAERIKYTCTDDHAYGRRLAAKAIRAEVEMRNEVYCSTCYYAGTYPYEWPCDCCKDFNQYSAVRRLGK